MIHPRWIVCPCGEWLSSCCGAFTLRPDAFGPLCCATCRQPITEGGP